MPGMVELVRIKLSPGMDGSGVRLAARDSCKQKPPTNSRDILSPPCSMFHETRTEKQSKVLQFFVNHFNNYTVVSIICLFNDVSIGRYHLNSLEGN